MLLTGANGQLGKAFQDLFTKKSVLFVPTDVDELDITNFESIRELFASNEFKGIINCAAYNNVDKAEEEWQNAFLLNSLAPKNLSIIANEYNIPILHFSTNYVFDGQNQKPYTIFDKPNPKSVYAKSKYQGELNVINLNPKHLVIRTSWLFGDGMVNFIKKLIAWSEKNTTLSIADDEIAAPTYAPDLAEFSWNIFNSGAYGLYQISNKGICSRYEWAKFILQEVGWKGELTRAKISDFNLAAKRPKYAKMDGYGLKYYTDYDIRTWQEATLKYLSDLSKNDN